MANKFRSVSDFAKELSQLINKEFAGEQVLLVLAALARETIYRRVKSGYGATPEGVKQKLKALSPRYIDYRAGNFEHSKKSRGKTLTKNKGKIKLGAYGSPSKSNLTLTGETLESIAIKVSKNSVILYFPDKAHPIHRSVTIREIAQYLEEGGRPFFYLTRDEVQVLIKKMEQLLDKVAKSLK